MISDINHVRDAYNDIKLIESRMHKVKTMHSLGKITTPKAKKRLRLWESRLQAVLLELPLMEKHYYNYKRLYGHPARP